MLMRLLFILISTSIIFNSSYCQSILTKNQKLYIGEVVGEDSTHFDDESIYPESFGLASLKQTKNLIEIRCYQTSTYFVDYCSVLAFDTAFSISRKVRLNRPYDTAKFVLEEFPNIKSLNPDTIISKLIHLGIFSFKSNKNEEKTRMILNNSNQLEPYKGLIGVLDGILYRVDIKVGNIYNTIYTSTTSLVKAKYFIDDIDLKREVEIVNLLGTRFNLNPKKK